jgi:CBS domain-containing protein
MRLKVKDIMTAAPVTVPPDLPFKEVADRLIERNIGGVPVVDDSGAVLGVITETDLITKPAYAREEPGRRWRFLSWFGGDRRSKVQKAYGPTARDIMTAPPVTAGLWDDVEEVARQLLKHHIGRLPVVHDGQLVGIVSRRDLVRQFHHTDEQILADVEDALHDPLLSESDPRVTFTVQDGIVALRGTVRYPHDIETISSLVAGIGGVVDVRTDVTAGDREPSAPPADAYPDGQVPRRTY